MEYNSRREKLIISEYGRHVQGLIKHAKTIEDAEYRQAFVEKVVDLMNQMNPQVKNVKEHTEKLWRHVFRIADYELDVQPTVGERPSKEDARRVPDQLSYPQSEFRFRHYGNYIQQMISNALGMDDNVKKMSYALIIAQYMKLAYRMWNKDQHINDEIIKQDLKNMSKGELILPAEVEISDLVPPESIKPKSSGKKSSNNKKKKKNFSNSSNRVQNGKNMRGAKKRKR